ncbi:Retrovirus-related Pol polyprotein from transposon TNT 1-94 [Araneus ventricosus]|uniref:Retrovirus-related Pol polyprotein from transposon TNT 1-94 n=1 Tax=Araneus ventricosus TaxID=182803 RepID=A0A4Y2UFJ4_ARAVE|nr:Retrovirus-related Pol polyprotein from transposon TNT 1-94 [Araneus ventricosus]
MCFNEHLFTEINPIDDTYVKLAVDKTVKAIAKGTVTFDVLVGSQTKGITLQNVLYIPDLKNNLISISKVTANNFTVKFQRNHASVINSKNETVLIAKREKGKEIEQWHQKFGHLNEKDLKKLQAQNMVYGMNFKPNDTLKDCKICIQGKQTATPFSKEPKNRSSQLLSVIHSDLCGPMRVESIGRSFYFATFIDDCSRFVHVYFLRSKDEVESAFLEFKAYIENKLNCKIKTLRTDQGLEYVGPNFDHYLVKNGIKRERTCAYTPQMNGIAERENRTLVNMARCLLLQSGLPMKFWAEAINCAVYIRNRCPTRGLQDENQTPFQKLFGKKPTVKHFQTFGQKAFALNKQPQKGKFDARSTECIFTGYSDENRVYRLFDSQANKVITSRDVKFINEFENTSNYEELFFPEIEPKEKEHLQQKDKILSSDIMDSESKGTIQSETQEETHPPANDQITDYPCIGVGSSRKESKDSDINGDCTINVDAPRARGRPTKIFTGKPGRPRKQYNIKEKIEEAQIALEDDTPSLKEALNGPNSEEWLEAMQTEYNALLKNKAWKLVKRQKDKNII